MNKNVVLLTHSNILERSTMYYNTHIDRPCSGSCVGETRVRKTCTEVILAMIHSGKYKLASCWAKDKKLDKGTLNLLWKSHLLPDATSLHELEGILIDTGDRRPRYSDAAQTLAPDGNPHVIPQTSNAIEEYLRSGGKRAGPGRAGAMMGMMRAFKYRAAPPKRFKEDRSFGLETYLGDDDMGAVISSQGDHVDESELSCPSDLEYEDRQPKPLPINPDLDVTNLISDEEPTESDREDSSDDEDIEL